MRLTGSKYSCTPKKLATTRPILGVRRVIRRVRFCCNATNFVWKELGRKRKKPNERRRIRLSRAGYLTAYCFLARDLHCPSRRRCSSAGGDGHRATSFCQCANRDGRRRRVSPVHRSERKGQAQARTQYQAGRMGNAATDG